MGTAHVTAQCSPSRKKTTRKRTPGRNSSTHNTQTRRDSLTHSLTRVKHGASQSTAQCARKHFRARAALAHTQEALAKKVGIVPSLRLCCPSVVTPPGRRWPLLCESLLRYPNRVFYTCRRGYSLDRKLGNATNVSSTNMGLRLPAHWIIISSIGESLCRLATSISIVSSVSHFGVSLVSREVAHSVCRHGHTVDGNSGAEYSSCWVTHRQCSLA